MPVAAEGVTVAVRVTVAPSSTLDADAASVVVVDVFAEVLAEEVEVVPLGIFGPRLGIERDPRLSALDRHGHLAIRIVRRPRGAFHDLRPEAREIGPLQPRRFRGRTFRELGLQSPLHARTRRPP